MKRELSKEQKEQHEYNKMIARKIRGLATRVKNRCKDVGLRTMELQFKWLKDHPATELPVKELDYDQTIEGWEIGFEKYREHLDELQTNA